MEKAKVFISSVMDYSKEDLREARQAAREVAESFGFLRAWTFEMSPASTAALDESYLSEVDTCDLFLIIVGRTATNPVASELKRAKDRRRPVLVFARRCEVREPLAQMLLEQAGTKYAPFTTIQDLREAARGAIAQACVRGLRLLANTSPQRAMFDEIEELATKNTLVRLAPLVPVGLPADFHLKGVTDKFVVVEKVASHHTVEIPRSAVVQLLPGSPPTLLLEGRIQWTTPDKGYHFFPEKPTPGDLLGCGKIMNNFHPDLERLKDACKRKWQNAEFCWDRDAEIAQRQAHGWEVVYDLDGRYLKMPGTPFSQLFFMKSGA